jgi:ribosomal protein S17E
LRERLTNRIRGYLTEVMNSNLGDFESHELGDKAAWMNAKAII